MTRYLAVDAEVTPLSATSFLALAPGRNATYQLGPLEVRILRVCQSPRSIDEHANQVLSEMTRLRAGTSDRQAAAPALSRERVVDRLEDLIAKGLVLSESDIFTPALREPREAGRDVEIMTSVYLPTRNRPLLLARALSSYLANDERYGRTTELVVVDDGTARSAAETRGLATRLKGAGRSTIRYADREDRRNYAATLARAADLPDTLTEFALLGEAGATRNTVLLDALDTLCLQTDDDTVCTVFRPPHAAEGVRLSSEGDVNEYWYCADLATAVATAERVDVDLLAVHESVLGRTVQAVLDDSPVAPTLGARVSPRCVRDAYSPGARVAVSYGGTVGDRGGLGLPQHRLRVAGASFDRLIASQQQFETGYRSMQMIRCAERLTISDVDLSTTANMGLDNRVLLPPFMPQGPSEDILFGMMRSAMGAGAYAAFLPYGVLHDAGDERASGEAPATAIRTADVLVHLTDEFVQRWPAGGGRRLLNALGTYFAELGALPPTEFANHVRRTVTPRLVAEVHALLRLLDARRGAPEFWRSEVRRYRAQCEAMLLHQQPASPSDQPGPPERRQRQLQRLLADFGALIQAWPQIVHAARELRWQGTRVSRPL